MTLNAKPADEIESIREELARARREASAGPDGSGTMVSASSMNFVVYMDRPEYRDWIVERAEKIVAKYPARLLILDAQAERHGASLSTTGGSGTTTVRTERVEIGVDERTPEQIFAIANSLTLPSVPSVLWWTGTHVAGDRTFEELIALAEYVVVDSSGGARDDSTVKELANFLSRHRDVALHDLAWMRLAPWRDMIAQFFDDPALREELFAIRSVTIAAGSDAEALYLGGWLGSRLGWIACHRSMFCDRRGAEIPFVIERAGEMRRVVRVQLETRASTYTAEISEDDGRVVRLMVDGERARPERVVPLQSVDNASLIERAILERSTDEIFETSLRMVGRLSA